VSTALEALEASDYKNRTVTLGQLSKKYGAAANDDSVRCDRYRYTLRHIIVNGWKRRRSLTTSVVDELTCYAEVELREEAWAHRTGTA